MIINPTRIAMKLLAQLTNLLNKEEQGLIYAHYSNSQWKSPILRMKLLSYVLEYPDASESDACWHIYAVNSSTKFSHLKKQLRDDLLNILMMRRAEKSFESKLAQADFDCKKKILQSKLLFREDLYELGMDLLHEALALAVRYELFSLKIIINDLINSYEIQSSGKKLSNAKSNQNHQDLDQLRKSIISKENYYKITLSNKDAIKDFENYRNNGQIILAELEELLKEDKSVSLRHRYLLTSIQYHVTCRNFNEAMMYANKLIELVSVEDALNAKVHYAGSYQIRGELFIQLGNYLDAEKDIKLAFEYFKEKSMNELKAYELLFYALFYQDKYDECHQLCKNALSHNKLTIGSMLEAKWLFFLAYINLVQGKYEEGLQLLYKNRQLMKDKNGWLIGYKILEWNLRCKLDDYYYLLVIENSLSQLLQREKKEVQPRARKNLQLMRTYTKYKNTDELIDQLLKHINDESRYKEELQWNPLGYELIKTDVWVMNKAKYLLSLKQNNGHNS